MARYLIVYGTTEGQTAKIAGAIRSELEKMGHRAEAFDAGELDPSLRLEDYDSVIVGASVHASGFQARVVRWVKANAERVSGLPSAFFSVCLGVLQESDRHALAKEHAVVERFFERTGWKPGTWTIFPGALSYSQYNWLIKRVMRRIARQAGGSTDMSRDHEYTDWNEVRKFAGQIGATLAA